MSALLTQARQLASRQQRRLTPTEVYGMARFTEMGGIGRLCEALAEAADTTWLDDCSGDELRWIIARAVGVLTAKEGHVKASAALDGIKHGLLRVRR